MWLQLGLLQALSDAGRFSGAFGLAGRRLVSSFRPTKVLQCLQVWALQGIFARQPGLGHALRLHGRLSFLTTVVVAKPPLIGPVDQGGPNAACCAPMGALVVVNTRVDM